MAAPIGNQFWKLRSRHGRKKLFETPDLLWEAACEYFQWCDDNPWTSRKVVKKMSSSISKKNDKTDDNKEYAQQEVTPTARPYTLTGLCLYCDTTSAWWYNFKDNVKSKKNEDFISIITRIEEIIETQQFEGACVGAFNASIISRKLGLADKQEIDHTTQGESFKGFEFLPYTHEVELNKND